MNRVLILEGPDGAGKTTLAEAFVTYAGFERWHEGPTPQGLGAFHYYLGRLVQALRHPVPVVFDRFHIGEYVYGPIFRGADTLGYSGLRYMDKVLNCFGVPLLLAIPEDYEQCRRNWYKTFIEKHDFIQGDQKKFCEVYHRFLGLQEWYPVYDYQKEELKKFVDETLRGWPKPTSRIGRLAVGDISLLNDHDVEAYIAAITTEVLR